MADWYAVETHSRAEFRAQRSLERQGFSSFLPRFLKARRHARRVDQVVAPVFPGYLFVSFDPKRDRWRAINSTFGVRRLVSFSANQPHPMPADAMTALMERCEAQMITRQLPDIAVGDEVRVLTGAFAQKIGRIEDFDDKGRVEILMEMLGRSITVRMRPSMLGPVAC